MSAKRLLAILGSPHPDGATAAMLDCAVRAAREAGWEDDRISLYDIHLAPCLGCRTCLRTGLCEQRDGLETIAALLRACDAVALAAPTYWGNVPGPVKTLLDRLLGVTILENGRFPKPRLSARQGYLLLTACNAPFPFSHLSSQGRGAIAAMERVFRGAGMKRMGWVVDPAAWGRPQLPPAVIHKIRRVWL